MYVPKEFSESDVPVLHRAMRELGFGTLVTAGEGGIIASHIPLLIEPEPAPYGTICGHLARANPQTRSAAPEREALAIFLGPHTYISPSWYPTKAETGKVVPTWNYVAIHAYGRLRFVDDLERTIAHVTKLTQAREGKRAVPWAVSDAPADYIKGMARAIIGFELAITRLEGKWKMSQNRVAQDRAGVVEGLVREGGETSAAVAAIVAERAGKG